MANPVISKPVRAYSYYVAASDSPAHVKAQADRIYTSAASKSMLLGLLNSGYDVKLAPGTYPMETSGLKPEVNDIVLVGSGKKTVLQGDGTFSKLLDFEDIYNVTVRDLMVDQVSGYVDTSGAINIKGVNGYLLENVWTNKGGRYGVQNYSSTHGRLINVRTIDSNNDGISFEGPNSDIEVIGCRSTGSGESGLEIDEYNEDIRIIGGNYHDNPWYGIMIVSHYGSGDPACNRILINGVLCKDNSGYQLFVRNQSFEYGAEPLAATNLKVVNSFFYGTKNVWIRRVTGLTFDNNNLVDRIGGNVSAEFQGCQLAKVRGNTIRNTVRNSKGIYITEDSSLGGVAVQSKNFIVSDNQMDNVIDGFVCDTDLDVLTLMGNQVKDYTGDKYTVGAGVTNVINEHNQ